MMPADASYDDEETLRNGFASTRATAQQITWAARSSTGHRRADNQDAWGERGGCRFVVADGVGGTHGGAIASAAAVAEFLSQAADTDWSTVSLQIDEAVRFQCSSRGVPDAATTLTGCDIDGLAVSLVHVGDSRAYRLRSDVLECLTVDHNLANLRKSEGTHPESNDGRGKPQALTSFFGRGDPTMQVDVLDTHVEVGDRLLLCSDGVHDQLSEATLARLLAAKSAADAADALVVAADAAGGRDNATALVIVVAGE